MLDLMEESETTPRSTRFKSSFQKEEPSGDSAIDMFIDRVNPFNKAAHPALPNVMKQLDSIRKKRGSRCFSHRHKNIVPFYVSLDLNQHWIQI